MKKYDTYKDSGIEWIGEIPSHWDMKRFKYCFHFVNDKIDADLPKIGLEHIESWTGKLIENDSDYEGDGTYFRPNDILFGKLRPYLAKVHLSKIEGKAVGDFFVFRSSKAINPKYGHKILLSRNFIDLTNSSTFGSKMPRVSPDFIAGLKTIIPPFDEQTAIAHFLDRKTAEIDELIADKKRLLELYEEEKTTIINQAVTKGINPNATLKDSGIEWLGEIPDHWEMKRLKDVASINDEVLTEKTDENYEIEYVEISGVKSGLGIVETSNYRFKDVPSRARRIVKDGDVLVSTVRTYLKSIAKVDNPPENLIASTGFAVVRPRNTDPDYLGFLFYSESLIGEIISMSNGVSYPAINASQIGDIKIPVPPIKEQKALANFINENAGLLNKNKAKTGKLIELLTEYRTALISEVVTGKVKVIE